MSHWEELDIAAKLTEILSDVHYTAKPDHHFGRPFLTAYQLAIEFANRHPEDVVTIGQPIGGSEVGQRSSLAQYLAGQLSSAIRDGRADHIEGSFLANRHLASVSFKHGDRTFDSSLTNTQYDLSMFRLRE